MIDTPHIWYRSKSAYGVTRIYPACLQGEKIARLLGVKTFTVNHVKALQDIGFEFKRSQTNTPGFSVTKEIEELLQNG